MYCAKSSPQAWPWRNVPTWIDTAASAIRITGSHCLKTGLDLAVAAGAEAITGRPRGTCMGAGATSTPLARSSSVLKAGVAKLTRGPASPSPQPAKAHPHAAGGTCQLMADVRLSEKRTGSPDGPNGRFHVRGWRRRRFARSAGTRSQPCASGPDRRLARSLGCARHPVWRNQGSDSSDGRRQPQYQQMSPESVQRRKHLSPNSVQ